MPSQTRRSRGDPEALPLSALLSQALVAFTIEFDNEFEHQMPHRTAKHGSTGDSPHVPWLVSLPMWALLLRFVPEHGIAVRQLLYLSGFDKKTLKNWLVRLSRWWGYLTIAPDLAGSAVMPSPGDWIVRPTAGGLKAQQIWRPLFGTIEKRWRERFGKDAVGRLRASLAAVVAQLNGELPEYLPILGYGLRANLDRYAAMEAPVNDDASKRNLPALLSQALLAFTIEFEGESALSLAICANVLRVLSDEGVRTRDLPRLSGVSSESIKMGLGFLGKGAYVTLEAETPASRTKLIRLDAKGLLAQDAYWKMSCAIEERWRTRFGAENIRNLREALEPLVGSATGPSLLLGGLQPYPECWRAAVARPETLPHYPMVLHRGGYPDGS